MERTDPEVADEIVATVRRFVEREVLPVATELEHADEYPTKLVEGLRDLGLFGATVPAEHGGLGLGVADLAPVWRALSHGWISLTGAVNPTGLATALLVRHGSEHQRERWLPQIAKGDANKIWVIPSELTQALGRLTSALPRGDEDEKPAR
jgi:alkylation response protein AidB-like acyl-CoA dehydrogenase